MTTAGSNDGTGTGGTGSNGSAAGAEGSQGGTEGSGEGSGTGPGAGGGQNGGQGGAGSGTGDGGQGDGGQGGNGEAARYRTQLRAAETERDEARGHLERYRTREVERIAGEDLAAPGDLLAIGGTPLADLLNESGDVDAAKVRAAAQALTAARPGLRSPEAVRRGGGIGGGRIPGGKAPQGGWASALRGNR